MRNARNAVLAVIVAICALSSVLAASKFEVRSPSVRRGFYVAPNQSTVEGIGIGKPTKFAFLNAWTTSDGLANICGDPSNPNFTCPPNFLDTQTTDVLFFTDESVTSVINFYTLTTKDVTVTVQVKTPAGATAFTDTFTGPPPESDVILFIPFVIGQLPASYYKINIKIKQGSTVVGGTYWFTVNTPPPLSSR